jgi:hypothetical protein
MQLWFDCALDQRAIRLANAELGGGIPD